jgi:hypothetical protein
VKWREDEGGDWNSVSHQTFFYKRVGQGREERGGVGRGRRAGEVGERKKRGGGIRPPGLREGREM